jgi:NitT/TauT family transport system substrate-binding protein
MAHVRWAKLFAILAVVGCVENPRPPIRIGIAPWPAFEVLYLAQERELFASEGVDVRLVEYSSLGDARRAYERGDVDGMTCTLAELLRARERGQRRPVAILMTDVSNGADALIARAPIASPRDLAGRRVGVDVSSIGPLLVSRALDSAGLALRHVTLVAIDAGDARRALAEGRVEAVASPAPESLEVLRDEASHAIFSSAELPGEIVRIVALDDEILARRTSDATALVRAWDRAVRLAVEHPAESDAIMAGRERTSVEDFRDALDGCRLLSSREQRPSFAPGGALERAIRDTDRILRAADRIRGDDHTAGCISDAALPWTEVRD